MRPVLATKLSAPMSRGGFVPRPDLIEVLERGRRARLTAVCAPTGSGRTGDLATHRPHVDPTLGVAEPSVSRFDPVPATLS